VAYKSSIASSALQLFIFVPQVFTHFISNQ
jgi:hypothetical protein